MTIKSFNEKNQIKEIATMIRNTGNTCMIDIYAIQDKETGLIINYKNKMFYTTRQQARDVRRSIPRNDIRIVKTSFVNVKNWKTSK